MNTKKLKQLVLDLAIHGKLVPQDPNDEPASELLKRIQADVETHGRASNKSKGKKSAVSSVDLDEVPFEVPEGWCWTRLIEVCSVFSTGPFGSMVHKSDYVFDKGVPLINPANIKDGKIDSDKLMFVSEAKSIELSRYRLSVNDVLLARRGDLSKCAIVSSKEENWLCGTGSFFLRLIFIQPEFFLSFYSTNYLQSILSSESVGATMDNLNQGLLGNVLFPLPPLAEQHRIVAAIEKWFAVIDQLEKNEADLKKSIEQTKKKVLDLAIRGKLVKQEKGDEPASELLARIRADKAEAQGRASKGKKTAIPSVDLDEVPFEVPEGWEWCRLGEISTYGECQSVDVKTINDSEWTLELEDLEKDSARVLSRQTISSRPLKGTRHKFSQGDVLYSKLRTYLNKVLVAKENGYCTTEIIPIKFLGYIVPDFMCHVLRSQYFLDYTMMLGYGVKMPRLSTEDARKAYIPLPPLAEQKRIVEKIEEVMGVLERIEGMM